MNQIGPSLIRTVVPWIVGLVVGALAARGIDIPSDNELLLNVVTVTISTAYYAAVRYLETRFSSLWGWFLGLPKAPTYNAPAAPAEDSPTGAVATEDTLGVPEGEPVEVVAADEEFEFDPDVDEGVYDVEDVDSIEGDDDNFTVPESEVPSVEKEGTDEDTV